MEIKNPVTTIVSNYSIVYVKQVINEDETISLFLNDNEDGERCLVAILNNGQMVITNIGG